MKRVGDELARERRSRTMPGEVQFETAPMFGHDVQGRLAR